MSAVPTLLGTYTTPAFAYGEVIDCLRASRRSLYRRLIRRAHPLAHWQAKGKGRARSLVLYGDLVEAVKRESSEAIQYHWGVRSNTVWQWRQALDVGQYTEGTSALKGERSAPGLDRAREAAKPALGSPQRRAKISASMKGKKRPPHVVEAVRKAHKGKKHTPEAKAKMSAAQKARGARPPAAGVPWSAEEDDLLRTLSASDASQRTGRTLIAVYSRRRVLGLPDGRRR